MRSKLFLSWVSAALIVFLCQTNAVWAKDAFTLGLEAQDHISQKQYGKAIPLLVDALKQDPLNTWLRGMLANSYYQLRQFGEAKTQFELVVQMEPRNDLAQFMIGVLEPLAGLGRSIETPQERKELKPFEIEQRYGKAVVFFVVADKDKKPFKQGSGFIIREDGWVVTNHHVVVNGKYIVAKLPDGEQYAVESVISYEPRYDLAVVKLKAPSPLPAVEMGDSSKIILGEQAVAIGSPEGLEHTISDGLVSAWRDLGDGVKFIQISVPISHGSSGGALFNMRGEVIGVTSAGLERGQNLNFAIPINRVKEILQSPKPITLAELPEEKQEEKPAPSKEHQSDAELIRNPDGNIVCVNRKMGFGFQLTENTWNANEEAQEGNYILKCNAPNLQVQLHTFLGKEDLTDQKLVDHYRSYLTQNGFTLIVDFIPRMIQGNQVHVGVLNKEAKETVRTSMLLLLDRGRVFVFSLWYAVQDEPGVINDVQTIQNSFKVGDV